jgi:hypothetical protein
MNHPLRILLVAGAALATVTPRTACSQDAYTSWSQVEAAKETREYKEKLRDGGAIDDTAKAFLNKIALPQLALDANRGIIDRVRRRIRELLLTDIGDEKAFEEASRTIRDFMLVMAGDAKADPAVRVNAMLMVGDLRAANGKPWPAAAAPLATAAGDATLPMGVRVAALAGLARHAEAARSAADDVAEAFAKEALPTVVALVADAAKPAEAASRTVENAWMTSRALTILPIVMRAAPQEVAASLATIMADGSWPIDVRIRAAAALGATAKPESGVDALHALEAVRGLAVAALDADVAAADRRRSEQLFRGTAPGQATGDAGAGATTPDAAPIPEHAARRDAWRMALLADAVLDDEGDRGLAKLAAEAGDAAAELAKKLRENARTLDAAPNRASVMEAITSLAVAPGAAPPQAAPAGAQPEAAAPEPEPAVNPFEANPFGQ